jgi:hypothetical protein
MTNYAWPAAWQASSFEMRVMPNQRTFPSAFSPSTVQVVDVGGDYWMATLSLPIGITVSGGAAFEAFIDRMRGAQNSLSLHHLRRPVPLGTMRDGVSAGWTTSVPSAATWSTSAPATAIWTAGDPALRSAVAQFATAATLTCVIGATLIAGDHIGLPNGQTVRVLADATANGSGDMAIEFAPAARSAMTAYGRVTWNKPTVNFRLRDGAPVPIQWFPGRFDGPTFDLVEAT